MNSQFIVTAISLAIITVSVSGHPPLFSNATYPFPNVTNFGAWQPFKNFTGCQMGDKVAGLYKLKQYFRRFGYIPNPPPNFNDSFDDSLEEAIKTYQLNFNLNVTGFLDASTVDQIVRPRCGVADVINGTSSMNSGKRNSSSSYLNLHTVAHYSFFPGTPRWPSFRRSLTYAFSPSNEIFDVATLQPIFARAFARWSAVTPLTFTEISDYESADLRIGFFSGDHGDGEPFDGVLGTLAHAFSPPSGRFHLDAAENWVLNGDVGSSQIDLESVAVHEIGHLLGLGHSSVEDAIMYPTIPSGSRRVALASDDIVGIQVLYGANPNGDTETTSVTPSNERDMSDGGVSLPDSEFGWRCTVAMFLGVAISLLL